MTHMKNHSITIAAEVMVEESRRPLSAVCRQSADAVVSFFVLSQGQASVQPDLAMFAILSQCLQRISASFNLVDRQRVLSSDGILRRLLQSIFDADLQAFLAKGLDAADMFGHLSEDAHARMLAQAVAGLICLFRRLAAAPEVTTRLLNRELQLFAESEERRNMVAAIESSAVFSHCYMPSQLVDAIVAVVESSNEDAFTPTEELENAISWAGRSTLSETMGFGGFTIMALN